MGADMTPAPSQGASPSFLVYALRDPMGANLDRLQVVKGWVDASGDTHEKVYNVAVSGERKIRNNKVEPVGNTVNVEDASYTNSIGAPELAAVWQDPDFDPALRAFYYVRVLEIPTPRWTTFDAKIFGDALPEKAPAYGQERAYTSPIWYQPD